MHERVCICKLSCAEESGDTLQAVNQGLVKTEMRVSKADSQVSAAKHIIGRDARPDILFVKCRSVQHCIATFQGIKHLESRLSMSTSITQKCKSNIGSGSCACSFV